MRCLNSPPVLNSLESVILDSLTPSTRHIAIVGAGDGRLAKAARERFGAENIKFSIVEPRAALHDYLKDFPAVGEDPWSLSWFSERVLADGLFDTIIFYQIHEYWHGNVSAFQQLIGLLAPGGNAWVSYFNTAALDTVVRRLPPLVAQNPMGDPLRLLPQLDLAAWLQYLPSINGVIDQIWALLEPRAVEFLQNPAEPATWEVGDLKVPVKTPADAILYGGRFHALNFHRAAPGEHLKEPAISGAPLNGALYQALLLPYPDAAPPEAEKLAAQLEADAWQRLAEPAALEPNSLLSFLVTQLDQLPDLRSVLFIGAGWGRDALLLHEARPKWEVTGLESAAYKIEIGKPLLKNGVTLQHFTPGEALPFDDGAFDVAVSFGYFSGAYLPVTNAVLPELERVARLGVVQMEDNRGPDLGLHLKPFSLQDAQRTMGRTPEVAVIEINGKPTGLLLVKWLKPQ